MPLFVLATPEGVVAKLCPRLPHASEGIGRTSVSSPKAKTKGQESTFAYATPMAIKILWGEPGRSAYSRAALTRPASLRARGSVWLGMPSNELP
jgi:hypothetical protein